MSIEDQPAEETLGVLLPAEMVEKFGLKEGDVFELVDTGRTIALHPVNEALATQISVTQLDQKEFRVIVEDLTKLS
jgi:bifunctional DNA-binding transcriptional regulator/antitoxin component of YhaV-PrlF toxin-antitoxin module